jgi:hypothetical protein
MGPKSVLALRYEGDYICPKARMDEIAAEIGQSLDYGIAARPTLLFLRSHFFQSAFRLAAAADRQREKLSFWLQFWLFGIRASASVRWRSCHRALVTESIE